MKNRVGKGWAVVNVMEENAKIRAEVLQSLEGLSDDELNKKITDENWTIGQVLEHLYLLEEAVVKSVSHALKNGSDGPVETKPVYLAADRSKKRKAPAYLVPDHEYKTLEQMKEKLSRSREKLLSVIAEAGEEALKKVASTSRFWTAEFKAMGGICWTTRKKTPCPNRGNQRAVALRLKLIRRHSQRTCSLNFGNVLLPFFCFGKKRSYFGLI